MKFLNYSYTQAIVFMLVLTAGLAGCQRIEETDLNGTAALHGIPGTEVRFEVATGYVPATRTAFSGDVTGSTGTHERIDWKPGDTFSVYSAEAFGDTKTAEYSITGVNTPETGDASSIASEIASDTPLRWGTGEQTFYGVYPAPAGGLTGNTISGSISAAQTLVLDENGNYQPDMSKAYMYAVAKDASASGSVSLVFKPLFTAFQFQLKAADDNMAGNKLTAVQISSSQTGGSFLTGNFTAALDEEGNYAVEIAGGTGGNEIVASIPDGGVSLTSSQFITCTVLALPMEQTEVSLTLIFSNGSTINLGLKDAEMVYNSATEEYEYQWYSIPAGEKIYINNLQVPNYVFSLAGTDDLWAIQKQGLAPNGSEVKRKIVVNSYRVSGGGGANIPVGYHVEFSTDNQAWSSDIPGWLSSCPGGNIDAPASPSITYPIIAKGYSRSDRGARPVWIGTKDVDRTDKPSARDLSLYDIYGNPLHKGRSTANCYVVSRPGWYKIPCVYGNAIKYGLTHEIAYKNNTTEDDSQFTVLKAFVNHNGTPINDPWITGNGITINRAGLLWSDAPGLIQDVSYEDNFIYFNITPETIAQGNAVIAAYQGDAIVWSWHIWVTEGIEYSNNLLTSDLYPLEGNASNNFRFTNPGYTTILNVDLGWVDPVFFPEAQRTVYVRLTQNEPSSNPKQITFSIKQKEVARSYYLGSGPYYQWGRKDPFLRFGGTPTWGRGFHATYYLDDGTALDSSTWENTCISNRQVTVEESISHPDLFFNGAQNWCTADYLNLWNGTDKCEYTDCEVIKTVYDPCPVGFCMPNRKAFGSFLLHHTYTAESFDDIPQTGPGWSYVTKADDLTPDSSFGRYYKRNNDDTQGVFFGGAGMMWSFGASITNGRIGSAPNASAIWTASEKNSTRPDCGYSFQQSSGGVTGKDAVKLEQSFLSKSNGLFVRPMKDYTFNDQD